MEVEQAMEEAVKARPVRLKWGISQGRPTNVLVPPHVNTHNQSAAESVDMNAHHVTDTTGKNPVDIRDKPSLSSGLMWLLWKHVHLIKENPTKGAFTQKNKANKSAGHVKNWVNIVVTAGNRTLSNSVALDLQSEQMPNPPSSTIPSLMTKATSVSSSVSNTDAVYKKTHREVSRHHNTKPVVSTTITHANPESNDKFDQSIFKVAHTTSLPVQITSHCNTKQVVSTTIPCANPESDDKFGQSIVEAAQTGLKHKHASHDSTEYITSEVEEVDNDRSDISIYDRNAKPKSHVTTLVHLLVHLSPILTYVELQTNISVNKPVKKAKTSNNLQHGATDTLAEDLGQSVLRIGSG
ncbi:hypothetical protein J3A83DRAFT_4190437 [Scleroderma citrinum]